jgi:hypothetical protein
MASYPTISLVFRINISYIVARNFMASNEYTKALDKALADLAERVQRRDLLNAEIAGLKEMVRVLSSRVSMARDKQEEVARLIAMVDSATPKLTDAVRSLLTREYPKDMTAIEVRNALEESSNFDDFSNSLSACHSALKRMLADGEVELRQERNGKATYRRVLRLEPPPAWGELVKLSGLFTEYIAPSPESRNSSDLIRSSRPKYRGLTPPPGLPDDKK